MRGLRLQDQARLATVLTHPVGVEGLKVALGGAVVGGDNGADFLEVGDVGGSERREAGVALDSGVAAIATVNGRSTGEGSGGRDAHDSAVNRTSFVPALFIAVAAVAGRSWDPVLAWRWPRAFSSARQRGRAVQGLARAAAARRSRAVFMMLANWLIHAAGRNVGGGHRPIT